MAIETIDAFIAVLRRSRLLDAGRMAEIHEVRARFTEATGLAWYLLDQGWLTLYQVNHLLRENHTDLVLDDYVLQELLGRGGIGEVYRARGRESGHDVALKVIHAELLARPEAIEQFRWEMQVLSELRHSNIVRILGAQVSANRCYFAMEYLEGTHLGRLVHLMGPVPVDLACNACRQAALGLQYAHEHGLIHRDIKPGNLLVVVPHGELLQAAGWEMLHGTKEWSIKILDWGLAALRAPTGTASPRQSGVTLGTADYIAPEQALNPQQADIRADIYSLGCTLYFLLAGQPPFPEGSAMQKLLKHQQVEPTPIEKLRAEVPAALGGLLRKMMSKDAAERLATPADVAGAFEPWCQSWSTAAAAGLSGARLNGPVAEEGPGGVAAASDRRVFFRHHCRVDGICRSVNAEVDVPWPAEILDLSRGGVGLCVERRFELGTLLDVELFTTTPHESRHLMLRVVNLRRQKDGRWIIGGAFARELTDQELWSFRAERIRPPSSDCRAWLRMPVAANHAAAIIEPAKLPTKIINISPGGIALLVKHHIDAGTRLHLEIQGDPELPPLMVLAYVIHSTAQTGGTWALGCAFACELSHDELEALM